MYLYTAFTLGLIGSLHCVGMCGPIALALPFQSESRLKTVMGMLSYQIGRVITYTLLGLVLGLLGLGLFIAGIQTYVSIALGVIMLIVAIFSVDLERFLIRIPLINQLNQKVKYFLGSYLKQTNPNQFFIIGMINGLVPCGLVYMAVIGALTTQNMLEGALFMASFGMGTVPLMLSTTIAGSILNVNFRKKARKLMPILLAIIAILFIYRGLVVHLPADFRFIQSMNDVPMCHD